MKRGLTILLLCAAHAHAGEAETVFNAVRESVVTLNTYDERKEVDGSGSGVVTGPERVVSNCHVVQESVAIRVRAGDKEWAATLALMDSARDLCLLDVPGLTAPAAKIRSYRDVPIGEPIYAVGNPLGFGLAVSAGLVSSIAQHKGELRLFSSAPISPGSSGGGLFDSQGRLIGITTGFYPGAQNLNLAVPADWIAELSARNVPKVTASTPTPEPDWLVQAEKHQVAGEWVKLVDWSRRWLEAYPMSASAGATLGLALLKLERAAEAKPVLLAALKNDPENATAYAYLAETRFVLGEKQAALMDLQKAITLAPASGYYHYVRAHWQRASGDYQGALDSIQTALKFDSGLAHSWDLLANLYQHQKRYAEAAEASRSALRLHPNLPQALSSLAFSLAKLGEAGAARHALQSSKAIGYSGDAEAWLVVAIAEEKQGRFAEAERAYRKALEISPNDANTWQHLGRFLTLMSRLPEAEEALRHAVKHKPDFAPNWVALGSVISQRGDLPAAREAFEKATAADPANAEGWFGLGVARSQLKDYSGAVAPLKEAVRLDPSKSGAWAYLGEIQFRSGQRDAALKSLQEAEKLDAKNEMALIGLAMYFGMSGAPDKALDYALRALALNPASAQHWNGKGYSLLKLQRYPEAIPALETATRLQPDMVAAWINLGEAYLRAKQLGKAISTLEQALKLSPRAVDARMFIAQAYAASGQPDKSREQLGLLLQQTPDFAPAWALMTMSSLALGNQAEALASFHKLKRIDPVMAHKLSLAHRQHSPLSNIKLP